MRARWRWPGSRISGGTPGTRGSILNPSLAPEILSGYSRLGDLEALGRAGGSEVDARIANTWRKGLAKIRNTSGEVFNGEPDGLSVEQVDAGGVPAELLTPETAREISDICAAAGVDCRVLDLKARGRKATYASAVWWIGEDDSLPRKARLSLRSGKVSKEIRFVEYSDDNGGPRLQIGRAHV